MFRAGTGKVRCLGTEVPRYVPSLPQGKVKAPGHLFALSFRPKLRYPGFIHDASICLFEWPWPDFLFTFSSREARRKKTSLSPITIRRSSTPRNSSGPPSSRLRTYYKNHHQKDHSIPNPQSPPSSRKPQNPITRRQYHSSLAWCLAACPWLKTKFAAPPPLPSLVIDGEARRGKAYSAAQN